MNRRNFFGLLSGLVAALFGRSAPAKVKELNHPFYNPGVTWGPGVEWGSNRPWTVLPSDQQMTWIDRAQIKR